MFILNITENHNKKEFCTSILDGLTSFDFLLGFTLTDADLELGNKCDSNKKGSTSGYSSVKNIKITLNKYLKINGLRFSYRFHQSLQKLH